MLRLMDQPLSMNHLRNGIGPVMSIARHVRKIEALYHQVLRDAQK
jgi:hypothetical protein